MILLVGLLPLAALRLFQVQSPPLTNSCSYVSLTLIIWGTTKICLQATLPFTGGFIWHLSGVLGIWLIDVSVNVYLCQCGLILTWSVFRCFFWTGLGLHLGNKLLPGDCQLGKFYKSLNSLFTIGKNKVKSNLKAELSDFFVVVVWRLNLFRSIFCIGFQENFLFL